MLVISNTKAVVLAFSSLEELSNTIEQLKVLRAHAVEEPMPPYLYAQMEQTVDHAAVDAYLSELKIALGSMSADIDHPRVPPKYKGAG